MDQDVIDLVFDQVCLIFDICNCVKIVGMIEMCFDQILFFDCDMVVLLDFGDVWDVLGCFDFVIIYDVCWFSVLIECGWQVFVLFEFCQYNLGVMFYNWLDWMLDFLWEWVVFYDCVDVGCD